MSILVIAEHDNSENKTQTLVTLAAAQAIGGEIHVLVLVPIYLWDDFVA